MYDSSRLVKSKQTLAGYKVHGTSRVETDKKTPNKSNDSRVANPQESILSWGPRAYWLAESTGVKESAGDKAEEAGGQMMKQSNLNKRKTTSKLTMEMDD